MLSDKELIGSYIRYSPEITEEIFDKIIKRLQEAGFTQTDRSEDNCTWLGTTYKDFQKNKYLWIKGKNWCNKNNVFSFDNHSSSCEEISYKDIIGEEEWCVVITEENRKVAMNYFTDFRDNFFYSGSKYGINKDGKEGYIDREGTYLFKLSKKTPVISTEEFYKKIGHVEVKEEVKSFQVHNKCNIGDIIVSLEPASKNVKSRKNGDLLKVLEKSTKEWLYYESYDSITKSNSHTYRLATSQEVEMYNNGIKNIYDKVEKEEGIVNPFTKKSGMEELLEEVKKRYPIGTHVKSLHEPFEGIIQNHKEDNNYERTIWFHAENGYNILVYKQGKWTEIIPSSQENGLITEAKQRYPIDSKFYPAHLDQNKEYCIVTNLNFKEDEIGNIVALTNEGSDFNTDYKYGNTIYNRVVYAKEKNRWATVVSSSQESKESDFPNAKIVFGTSGNKPELILKEDDEMIIFPNIKREKIVEIKIKLVD